VVRYRLPGATEIVALFKGRLTPYVPTDFSWNRLADLANGLSSAEITLVAQDAIKELLINDQDQITLPLLEAAIADRRGMTRDFST
jgi:hypothetical protein